MKKTVALLQFTMLLLACGQLRAAPDAVRGADLYQSRCGACHSIDRNRVGPAHQGVFGRRAGRAVDYDYSSALRASKLVWTARTLDAWLTNPQRLVPGQKMGFSVPLAVDRADIIAYLAQASAP